MGLTGLETQTVEVGGRTAVFRNCPLCDTSSVGRNKYSDATWNLNECSKCHFVYMAAAPIYEELVSDYSWERTAVDRHVARKAKYPFLYRLSKGTRWRLHLFPQKNK